MKIYFISPNPILGGAATANLSIAQMLSAEHVVIYNDEYNNVSVENVVYDSFPVHKLKNSEALYEHIMEKKVDWVIWGVAMNLPYYKRLSRRLKDSNIKQCVLFHSLSISGNIKGRLIEWLISRSIKNIDHLVFVSQFTEISWSKYTTIKNHPSHHVIYNPINIVRTSVNNNCERIGFVGRFSPEKQPEIFAELSEIDFSHEYVAWGEGELFSGLNQKYTKVKFHRYSLDREEVYKSFDILVMTSAFENCPMVILEAWQHGIPCVVPNVGGIPEIVKNECAGILYNGFNVEEILAAIMKIQNNYSFYCKNCSEAVKYFAYENIIHKWNNLIGF